MFLLGILIFKGLTARRLYTYSHSVLEGNYTVRIHRRREVLSKPLFVYLSLSERKLSASGFGYFASITHTRYGLDGPGI
jgi:hypothetical protein